MDVLVTGGAGFIGANLVRALVLRGDRVRALDDLSTGLDSNLNGIPVDLCMGSIADREAVRYALDGVEAVVHLAARGSVPRSIEDPVATHFVNVSGTLNVLEEARRTGARVIFSSSSSVYGSNSKIPKCEAMWTRPLSPYAASKLAAESFVTAYRHTYGLATVVFRFFNVYGPLQRPDHDYAAVIPKFVWLALQDKPLVIHGDGRQARDFTHVNDVVRILTTALDQKLSLDTPVNLAFGNSLSILDLVSSLGSFVEKPLQVLHGPTRAADVRESQNNPTLLRELFPGIVPTSFQAGIGTVFEWMRQTHLEK